MAKTVSVVVVLYNAAKWLDRCLGSIVNQTYKDLEIILVNDGSTDDSFAICEKYRLNDPRVRVISQANGGVSVARNRGIEEATGDYLCFVDADDWLDDIFFERMVSVHEDTGSDVTICNYKSFDEEKSTFYFYAKFDETYVKEYTPSEWFRFIYGYENFGICFVVPWGKIYNRDLFENIRYPAGKIAEDDYTTYYTYLLSDKITYVHETLYNYRKNPEGITSTYTLDERLPLQTVEEQFTMATLTGDIDTAWIRTLYIKRMRVLQDWALHNGKTELYHRICLKLQVLKKHGINVD